ncbi:MAG: hypothetical protein PHS98_03460 [Bacilli bacterium]|nr:hypothetical protein [Bacilli bacterium]
MWILACDPNLIAIIKYIKKLLQVIQILIPIGLIVMGTIDLGKAVISSNEDEIKKGQLTFMKRAAAAVLVFLVATIVNFVMGFLGESQWKECWTLNDDIPQIEGTTTNIL